jgi:hypothetical protein
MPDNSEHGARRFRKIFLLTKDEAASTFLRLGKSQHVADLRLIFWTSWILMLFGGIFIVTWEKWAPGSSEAIGSGALIIAMVGAGCGVLAWTYQTG